MLFFCVLYFKIAFAQKLFVENSFSLVTAQPQFPASGRAHFDFYDYNSDGVQDLYMILPENTGSGKLEVHVLNGATSFTTYLANIATISDMRDSNSTFKVSDYNGDGIGDLYTIIQRNTVSGKVEIHVLNGATSFQSWSANIATAQNATPLYYDTFIADHNFDGVKDLQIFVKNSSGSGRVEVHVLSGVGAFQTSLGDFITSEGPLATSTTMFALENPSEAKTDIGWIEAPLSPINLSGFKSLSQNPLVPGALKYQYYSKDLYFSFIEHPDDTQYRYIDIENNGTYDLVKVVFRNTGSGYVELQAIRNFSLSAGPVPGKDRMARISDCRVVGNCASNINNEYFSYAPSYIQEGATRHIFSCTSGAPSVFDHIRHIKNTSFLTNIAIYGLPISGNVGFAACDPSLVYFKGYYYIFYSSVNKTSIGDNQNTLQVARATQIDGPYYILNSNNSWVLSTPSTPSNPKAILSPISPKGHANNYIGIAWPSAVVKDGKLYIWYFDGTEEGEDVVKNTWYYKRIEISDTATMSYINKTTTNIAQYAGDSAGEFHSAEIKYDPASKNYLLSYIRTPHTVPSSTPVFVRSGDGINWDFANKIDTKTVPDYSHNIGVLSDNQGHLVNLSTHLNFAFGSRLRWDKETYGHWDLYEKIIEW